MTLKEDCFVLFKFDPWANQPEPVEVFKSEEAARLMCESANEAEEAKYDAEDYAAAYTSHYYVSPALPYDATEF